MRSKKPPVKAGFAQQITIEPEESKISISTDIALKLSEIVKYEKLNKPEPSGLSGISGIFRVPWLTRLPKLVPGRKEQNCNVLLFHGDSASGKTMAAKYLSSRLSRDLYRIDLSMVVSKYIGETEKNLSTIFDRAESKEWILYFDEADELFGKRRGSTDSGYKLSKRLAEYLYKRIIKHKNLIIISLRERDFLDENIYNLIRKRIYF